MTTLLPSSCTPAIAVAAAAAAAVPSPTDGSSSSSPPPAIPTTPPPAFTFPSSTTNPPPKKDDQTNKKRRRWGRNNKGNNQIGSRPRQGEKQEKQPSLAWLGKGHGRVVQNIGGGLLLPLFLLLKEAKASPFDPHPLPLLLGLCFFDGWYIRVTDHDRHLAFALIVGSFKHPGANAYTEHYVALVYSDKAGNFLTAHAFPDPDSVTIDMDSEGYVGTPSNFTWRSQEIGELHIDHNQGHFDFALPGFAAEATFHDRVPWSRGRPDVDGPEGWLGKTPLLPCRYFVYSMASRTSYRLRIRNRGGGGGGGGGGNGSGGGAGSSLSSSPSTAGPGASASSSSEATTTSSSGPTGGRMELISGRGFAHMESNYGNYFPRGWIWVNAIAPHRDVKLVMVGGKFEIGPSAPTSWVIGYRSPRFHWNFRTTDLDIVTANMSYSTRTLTLRARSRCGRHSLEVEVVAPEGSFGSPIYVPTPAGFSCLPGCRESFSATARIRAVDKTTSPKIVLEEEHEIPLAALECGGDLQRL